VHVIAVDLGASNGRVMKVEYTGDAFGIEEVHRFPNTPVERGGRLTWDIQQLWRETIKGIGWANEGAQSIGIDSWGVDFGLLDHEGTLIQVSSSCPSTPCTSWRASLRGGNGP